MRGFFQVLVGLVLGVAGIVVILWLGLLLNGPPDLWTGVKVLVLIAAGQLSSFLSFRHRIALQVVFGVALCIATAVAWVYSPLPMFWEIEDQPRVYSITWRSALAFLALMIATQWLSLLLFRRLRRRHSRLHF